MPPAGRHGSGTCGYSFADGFVFIEIVPLFLFISMLCILTILFIVFFTTHIQINNLVYFNESSVASIFSVLSCECHFVTTTFAASDHLCTEPVAGFFCSVHVVWVAGIKANARVD